MALLTDRLWEQPECTGMNRLPGRATLYPHPELADALRREPEESPWVISLDGGWKFRLFERPEHVEASHIEGDCQDSEWGDIVVPGNSRGKRH